MTSTQPANITHGFKVCGVSSMESHVLYCIAQAHLGLFTLEQRGFGQVAHTSGHSRGQRSGGPGGLMSCAHR